MPNYILTFGDILKILIDVNKVTLAFKAKFLILEDELETNLKEKGYNIPPTDHNIIKLSPDGAQTTAKRWIGDDVDIIYDPMKSFLSSEGTNIEKTSIGFKDIYEITKKLIDTKFDDELKWAEIYFICRCIGNKSPLVAFENSIESEIYKNLEPIVGSSMKPYSLNMYSAEENQPDIALNELINWYHISIQPLVANPKYYLVRYIYRNENLDNVEKKAKNINKIIESLINYIEGN